MFPLTESMVTGNLPQNKSTVNPGPESKQSKYRSRREAWKWCHAGKDCWPWESSHRRTWKVRGEMRFYKNWTNSTEERRILVSWTFLLVRWRTWRLCDNENMLTYLMTCLDTEITLSKWQCCDWSLNECFWRNGWPWWSLGWPWLAPTWPWLTLAWPWLCEVDYTLFPCSFRVGAVISLLFFSPKLLVSTLGSTFWTFMSANRYRPTLS